MRGAEGSPPGDVLRWLPAGECARFAVAGTDAFRLADGPGLWIERFGDAFLVSSEDPSRARAVVPEVLRRAEELVPRPAVFVRRLVRGPGEGDAPEWVAGDAPRSKYPAREHGLTYEVDFTSGYSCGLFPDQRANRARIRMLAPRRALNLFAFTCSFSVCVAAAGGLTTSVDLSKAALARGRRNFEINGLPTEGHRFYADDVFAVLPRLARRGERFDAIVIDPPTFSRRARGRVFRASQDLESLTIAALHCADHGAKILLSTNASGIGHAALRRIVRASCPMASDIRSGDPLPDIAPGRAATTLWFEAP